MSDKPKICQRCETENPIGGLVDHPAYASPAPLQVCQLCKVEIDNPGFGTGLARMLNVLRTDIAGQRNWFPQKQEPHD